MYERALLCKSILGFTFASRKLRKLVSSYYTEHQKLETISTEIGFLNFNSLKCVRAVKSFKVPGKWSFTNPCSFVLVFKKS